ncbi:hypothetical protein KIPB_009359, partial [Kipferlia bialata]|eukprot:g9359.t1
MAKKGKKGKKGGKGKKKAEKPEAAEPPAAEDADPGIGMKEIQEAPPDGRDRALDRQRLREASEHIKHLSEESRGLQEKLKALEHARHNQDTVYKNE